MAKKKSAVQSEAEKTAISSQHEAYEKLVTQFTAAMDALNKGAYTEAKTAFDEIIAVAHDEPVLIDRARTYARICDLRVSPGPDEPETAEERYYRAVMLINDGRGEEARAMLDRALEESPTSAKFLYARASAWAIQNEVDRAVSDLRQAISVDPQIRFQAVNDPDFEPIREEPAFIDIIEPTPSGA